MTTAQTTEEENPQMPESEEQTEEAEIQKLKRDLVQANTALSQASEGFARANADYQNLIKRVEQERRDMSAYFTENFAKKLLPTMDNLNRVVEDTPAELRNGAVYEGVKNATAGLVKLLESMGVTSYNSVGEELNPDLHEVLSQCPGPVGQVVTEFEKGYKLGEKVIRHAKVVVGSGE